MLTQPEFDEFGYEVCCTIENGVFEHGLKKGIPNVCWAMVWGEPYIDLIGKSVLNNAPVVVAEQLSDRHIYTQLTPDLFSIRDDYSIYQRKREELKDYLGRQYFWGGGEVAVPDFDAFTKNQ